MSAPIPLQGAIPLHHSTPRVEQEKQLREAAKMYERHFLNEMVKAMRQTVPENEGILPGTFAQKIYQGQLDEEYANAWGQQGGIGLADLIFDQLKERVLGSESSWPTPQGPLPLIHSVQPIPMKNTLAPGHNGSAPMPLPEQSHSGAYLLRQQDGLLAAGKDKVVTSPWSGQVVQNYQSPEGRVLVKINHGAGVESILNYQGRRSEVNVGERVEAGQKVGQLDLESGALVWSVTKTGHEGA